MQQQQLCHSQILTTGLTVACAARAKKGWQVAQRLTGAGGCAARRGLEADRLAGEGSKETRAAAHEHIHLWQADKDLWHQERQQHGWID